MNRLLVDAWSNIYCNIHGIINYAIVAGVLNTAISYILLQYQSINNAIISLPIISVCCLFSTARKRTNRRNTIILYLVINAVILVYIGLFGWIYEISIFTSFFVSCAVLAILLFIIEAMMGQGTANKKNKRRALFVVSFSTTCAIILCQTGYLYLMEIFPGDYGYKFLVFISGNIVNYTVIFAGYAACLSIFFQEPLGSR